MTEIIEARGWKEIQAVLRVKSRITAKGILRRYKLLCYDGRTPVLCIAAYRDKARQKIMQE